MPSRIRLFDRTGTLLYEPSAPAFREWVLNDIGNASFTLLAAGLESYIELGNYVTIEHDKLDAWVGVITHPRNWSSRIVTVNAKSAMWLFGQRVGSYTQAVNGSWGSVLGQVISIVNSNEPTLLSPGAYFDGISYSSIVDMSNVYTYLQRALAQAQTRLDFRPVVTDGKLKIFVDMQPALYTPSSLRLEEGLNVKNNTGILIEQGDIYNDVTILGIGLDQVKFTAHEFNTASISKYGLRQILFSEGQSQADVNRLAIVRLAQYAFPRKTLGLTTIDEGDTFNLTRTGASGAVELKSVGYTNGALGFQGSAYIRVVQFDDNTGEAVLVVEEIIDG